MEFFQTREYYIKNVERVIDNLKEENVAWDAKHSIKALAQCDDKQLPEFQQVYDWLLDALNNSTVSDEAEHLTLEQTKYANYLIEAVFDCVTMVI